MFAQLSEVSDQAVSEGMVIRRATIHAMLGQLQEDEDIAR